MHFLDHSLPTHAENLAWDEAIIEIADRRALEIEETREARQIASPNTAGESLETNEFSIRENAEVLRLWEMPSNCVILGRSSRIELEVNQSACEAMQIPVLRRVSGGATVVAGPGCLMYSTLLSYRLRPSLRSLDVAHHEVMTRIQTAVQRTLNAFGSAETVTLQGTCDLTIDDRKFSGNALRCKRFWMLYHGTILCDFPTSLVSKLLLQPPRQPDYRNQRSHDEFVRPLLTNEMRRKTLESQLATEESGPLSTDRAFVKRLKDELARAWNADQPFDECPWSESMGSEIVNLMQTRYGNQRWHQGPNT